MFKYGYQKENGEIKMKVEYTNWIESSENAIRVTEIISKCKDQVKYKFTSTLVSFIGATLDSFVLRFKLENQLKRSVNPLNALDMRSYLRQLKDLHSKFYELSSPYKKAVFISAWLHFLKQFSQYTNQETTDLLNDHLTDLQSTSNLLITVILPKPKRHDKSNLHHV